ncbi:MAG TPA: class I SAM-dependent methyltransferase [Kiloniellaceae bacterium]
MTAVDQRDAWTKQNIGYSSRMPRHFPTEYLLRSLCSRSYFALGKEIVPGQKVLDLGCLYLNNLMPFADRGLDLYGVEINDDMVAVATERAADLGMAVEIAAGHNRALPFPDGTFDFVLSINTIHYEDGIANVMAGLREIARVGKPDCHFLISTAGREHQFHRKAERLGPSRYRLATGEFRDGQVMSYFDDEAHFRGALKEVFDHVEIAVITERYPRQNLEFYVAKCCKG